MARTDNARDEEGEAAASRALEQQRGWYGEPLGDVFRRLIGELGLNQARLAAVLGLSAPMLSQLMSGQRAKIGNPAVIQRLVALRELASRVASGEVTREDATARMAEIRDSETATLLFGGSAERSASRPTAPSARRVTREIQALLRCLASAEELSEAAGTLAPSHPGLAEFLRVYGTGRTEEAVAHFEAHQD
jgi:transcriptional regulator with XRE-family HTH domain